jgi:hypothetical protein
MICEVCMRPVANTLRRGALPASDNPLQISFKGQPLALSPSESRPMINLIRFGGAPKQAIARAAASEDVVDPTKQTAIVIYRLR